MTTAELLAADFSIVPADKKKKALISWSALQTTPMSTAEAARHFHNDAQIAVIGGTVSGNLECIDFDEPLLYEPFIELLDLQTPGLRDRLIHHKTPSGGYHIIFRSEAHVEGNQVFAHPKKGEKTSTGKDVLIETRGEGGYFLTPPS